MSSVTMWHSEQRRDVMIACILKFKGEKCVQFTLIQAPVVKPLKQKCGLDEKHIRSMYR